MNIEGTIKLIGETTTFGSNGFRKRELVVTTNEQYPQHLSIEFVQDKADALGILKVGDSVKIDINLRGREWINPQGETKYFNSIQGWRIEKLDGISDEQMQMISDAAIQEQEEDDLPF